MKLGYGQTSETDPGFASGWQALVATYGTAIVAFVVGIVFAYVAATAYAVFVRPPSGTTLLGISLVTLQGAAFPLVAFLYLRWRGLNRSFLRVSWPSISDLAWVVGGYVVAFGLLVGATVALQYFSVETASNQAAQTAQQAPWIIPYLIPLQFLLVGPGEELLFRGIVQGTLREHFGKWSAILLASAAFAPAHILALTGSLQAALASIAVLFVPSIVFGYVYERTGNLAAPILLHGCYNATIFTLMYVAAKYAPQGASGLLGVGFGL